MYRRYLLVYSTGVTPICPLHLNCGQVNIEQSHLPKGLFTKTDCCITLLVFCGCDCGYDPGQFSDCKSSLEEENIQIWPYYLYLHRYFLFPNFRVSTEREAFQTRPPYTITERNSLKWKRKKPSYKLQSQNWVMQMKGLPTANLV